MGSTESISQPDNYAEQREGLLHSLRGLAGRSVLDAIEKIPRHEFVPSSELVSSYENRAIYLPGYKQVSSISQPRVVAFMTDLLDPKPSDTVLEIGTATGYQAAVLSQLVQRVYTIEILPDLAISAGERLRRLGIENVQVAVADGSNPPLQQESVNKIIITASIPPSLIDFLVPLLKPDGLLVAPIGGYEGKRERCKLLALRKTDRGFSREKEVEDIFFDFVLIQGERGWKL